MEERERPLTLLHMLVPFYRDIDVSSKVQLSWRFFSNRCCVDSAAQIVSEMMTEMQACKSLAVALQEQIHQASTLHVPIPLSAALWSEWNDTHHVPLADQVPIHLPCRKV